MSIVYLKSAIEVILCRECQILIQTVLGFLLSIRPPGSRVVTINFENWATYKSVYKVFPEI